MYMKHFVDQANITIKAGDGGDGAVSFRRERYVPKGGPDGGDGGKGGDLYVVGDTNLSTLLDFQEKKYFKADSGKRGGKQNKTGVSGEDMYINVPIGTVLYDLTPLDDDLLVGDREESVVGGRFLADINQVGQTVLLARGGEGGKGNSRFKSSVNQAPRECTPGEPGQEKKLRLELKVLADVGLIGYPNAGKSTLLSALTNARPEIAGYRFTTLYPNLGVLKIYDKEIVLADIPGLIEGAAEGKGLGDDFLRHIERTKVLVHLIDPTSAATEQGEEISLDSVLKAYEIIRQELRVYSEALIEKPELVAISKLDMFQNAEILEQVTKNFAGRGVKVIGISAATHENLEILQKEIVSLLDQAPEVETPKPPVPVFTLEDFS